MHALLIFVSWISITLRPTHVEALEPSQWYSYSVSVVFTLLEMCQMSCELDAQQCKSEYSIRGMMLKGHIFMAKKTANWLQCVDTCNHAIRCQSFNYVTSQGICELNNRTKEAKPEDFIPDSDRFYIKRLDGRVSLGSVPELPAESCAEIRASEGEDEVRGSYWFDSIKPGEVVLARCNVLIQAVLPPAVGCVNLTRLEDTNSYEVNANHDKPPSFCLVLPKEEINVGNQYTMTVELMNVIGWLGVNSGHPGVMYNVIDKNNFDFAYFRPHSQDLCYQLGYVEKGSVFRTKKASCPNGSPRGGVWFTVRVEVNLNKSVNIYLNDVLVTSLTALFSAKGRGGVLLQNGFQNIIKFRKLNLTDAS